MCHSVDRSWFLIIDPEPMGARLAESLQKLNLRVDLYPSVKSALLLLRECLEKPAVILLEIQDKDGLSLRLLPALREASPLTRFVVVTAYGSIASAIQALRLGAERYLCKPVSANIVLHVLKDDRFPEVTDPVHPSLDRAIWEYIHFVLAEEGTIAGAARRLGIQPRSLRRMLQKVPPAR
jgi:two-component system response regulator RegA